MGLFNTLRNEFIDIIDWVDESSETIIWKFPRHDNEIKMNAKLTVRESQQAVFLNEGTIADVFKPGMYSLTTQNLPILATLKGWKYGFDSPFKADVYFVSTRQFIDQRWGTKNAITLEDPRFGFIELRAFGTFAYRVTDAGKFLKEIAGTGSLYTTEEINGQLRSLMITKFSTAIGSGNLTIEKFAGNLEELSIAIQQRVNQDFLEYGLEITKFYVENVSMPDKVKEEIFEYSRLNKIDLQKLTQFKAAQSIETAAENSGIGGMGVGMGVGMGMGNIMANTMATATTPTPPPLPSTTYFVALNGQQSGPYNLQQLQSMVTTQQLTPQTLVWTNGMPQWETAQSQLPNLFTQTPPPLPSV